MQQMSGIQQIPIKSYDMKMLKGGATKVAEATKDEKSRKRHRKNWNSEMSQRGCVIGKKEDVKGVASDGVQEGSVKHQFNIQGQQYKTADGRIPVKMQINLRNGVMSTNKSILSVSKAQGKG